MNYRRICIESKKIPAIPAVRKAIHIKRGVEYTTSEIKRQNLTLFHKGKAYPQVPGSLFAGAVPDALRAGVK